MSPRERFAEFSAPLIAPQNVQELVSVSAAATLYGQPSNLWLLDTDLATQLIQDLPLPRRKPTTTFGSLMALDSTRRGGLTEEEFNKLFLKCSHCRLILTKGTFRAHTCEPTTVRLPQNAEIIDLTMDESDD